MQNYTAHVSRELRNRETNESRFIDGTFPLEAESPMAADSLADALMHGRRGQEVLQTTDPRIEWDSDRREQEEYVDFSFELRCILAD